MARNRRNQSAAIRFGPALKAFLLCLLIGGSGVGYVWQKNQIYQLGKQIGSREVRLGELKEQNDKFKKQLAFLRSPRDLERRIRDLGLTIPQPSQVWCLPEPRPDTLGAEAEEQYAQRTLPPTLP